MKNKINLGNKLDLDTELNQKFDKYTANRRSFLRGTAGVGAGFFGSLMLGACGGTSNSANADDPASTGPTDVQVLNFALNLEYLEAEFYIRASTGMGLSDDMVMGTGTPGLVTGGAKVPFATTLIEQYANEIAGDERDHVRFLRSALGSAAVARPTINFTDAFTGAARAAGLVGSTETFDPFANEDNFLLAAFIFEDVGVTAYKGAAPFVSDKVFLEAAAGLLAAEAYHAGLVRTLLYSKGVDTRNAVDAISGARDSLDGSSDIDQGISQTTVELNGMDYEASNIVPLDQNGLAYSRSPGQVLNIVYLDNNEVTQGGFFPNGVNGDINTSATN